MNDLEKELEKLEREINSDPSTAGYALAKACVLGANKIREQNNKDILKIKKAADLPEASSIDDLILRIKLARNVDRVKWLDGRKTEIFSMNDIFDKSILTG
jgi:hypothetical protein